MYQEIRPNGNGAAIQLSLNKNNECQVDSLAEYVFLESRGVKLQKFLKEQFGLCSVIEHFQSFYKFKVHDNHKLSKMFGIIEQQKDELCINQYSIKQASLEQIFNAFSKGTDMKVEETEMPSKT